MIGADLGMNKILRVLLWLNALGMIIYLTFLSGVLYLDYVVFPHWEVLSLPPDLVVDSIKASNDQTGLKEMSLLLHDHLVHQTGLVNELIDSTVFWVRFHFLFAVAMFTVNFFCLLKIRQKDTS